MFITRWLPGLMVLWLFAAGCTPTGPLSDSALAADPDLALTLTRAQESFQAAADSLAGTKQKVLSVTVDPEVGYFADLADSDYLLVENLCRTLLKPLLGVEVTAVG